MIDVPSNPRDRGKDVQIVGDEPLRGGTAGHVIILELLVPLEIGRRRKEGRVVGDSQSA
jgi:hypothetical protein